MNKTESKMLDIIRDQELTIKILKELLYDESNIGGNNLTMEEIDKIIAEAKKGVE